MVTKPKQDLTNLGVSYVELEDTKKIDLILPREELKPMYITTKFCLEKKGKLIKLFLEFRDVLWGESSYFLAQYSS